MPCCTTVTFLTNCTFTYLLSIAIIYIYTSVSVSSSTRVCTKNHTWKDALLLMTHSQFLLLQCCLYTRLNVEFTANYSQFIFPNHPPFVCEDECNVLCHWLRNKYMMTKEKYNTNRKLFMCISKFLLSLSLSP